ncbi:class I SAM-dependent methyltransferase [Winogradskyella sp. R77965]|uniref:class I SAM-dependent methyltransferase n=1 Tax=Winogradskyella sp. R77965 TaxID=3093872 RepID=UPI0037DD0058
MYSTLKNIAKSILPEKVLSNNERFFRKLIAQRYAGDAVQCNICEFKLKHFVKRANSDLLCPNCGSLSRTRRLYHTLKQMPLNGKALHFSPPKNLSSKLKMISSLDYVTTDFMGEFATDLHYDITSISENDNTFDIIICYHVLEHIKEDTKAMSELFRVLKPNGICLIQTPFKDGDIYEDDSITSEEAREIAFGQKDHVRVYSLVSLNERLQTTGFNTEIVSAKNDIFFGFRAEAYIKAIKP